MSVHLEGNGASTILGLEKVRAADVVAEDPEVYREVWRTHGGRRIFVGLRVDLATVPRDRFRELVELAWRSKAPKRLAAAHDADG